jgi:hypothetical protein
VADFNANLEYAELLRMKSLVLRENHGPGMAHFGSCVTRVEMKMTWKVYVISV